MPSDWNDREDNEPEAWRSDVDSWRGTDASPDPNGWRGDLHSDSDAWRTSLPEETESRSGSTESAPDHGWRGEVHFEDWPEWDAGPEYKMWKKLKDPEG
jgi:hypothetical protein